MTRTVASLAGTYTSFNYEVKSNTQTLNSNRYDVRFDDSSEVSAEERVDSLDTLSSFFGWYCGQ